jgi:molybdopterin converting factor small subunit
MRGYLLNVEIHVPQFLQHLTDDIQTVEVKGNTVGECLDDLVIRFPQLSSRIFDKNGKLQKHLDVWINGETGGHSGLVQPVADGDKLTVINIIAGG